MPVATTPFLARFERFATVGSTNDVVRRWLRDGTPEVCIAVADSQTAGRGREGRTWTAPAGAALLLSAGFRPRGLEPEHSWRLGALVGLAMAEASETVAGLPDGAIRLKWPNDLVALDPDGVPRKLAGVLGESEGLGTADPSVVVGIGTNVDWPAAHFPSDIAGTMTSLRETCGAPVDRDALLDAFLVRLESRTDALRAGAFDAPAWIDRQLTTGRDVRIDTGRGHIDTRALGVDPHSGALRIADASAPGGERLVHAGEIARVRLAPTTPAPGRV